jgi:hypothetical protein
MKWGREIENGYDRGRWRHRRGQGGRSIANKKIEEMVRDRGRKRCYT